MAQSAGALASSGASDAAASEAAWREYLGPLLDLKEVQQRLGLPATRAVRDLARRGRLLGLPTSRGALLFPAFQFSDAGEPYSALPLVLQVLEPVVETPYTIACWFLTPQPLLNGQTPARWLERGYSPERLAEAAEISAAWFAQ